MTASSSSPIWRTNSVWLRETGRGGDVVAHESVEDIEVDGGLCFRDPDRIVVGVNRGSHLRPRVGGATIVTIGPLISDPDTTGAPHNDHRMTVVMEVRGVPDM